MEIFEFVVNRRYFSIFLLDLFNPIQTGGGFGAPPRPGKQKKPGLNRVKDCGRRGGLVVSALDSESRGPGSSPGRVTALCSWEDTLLTLKVPLSTQEYKWVPANCQGNLTKCWEVTCDGLAFRPGGVCYGNRVKLRQ